MTAAVNRRTHSNRCGQSQRRLSTVMISSSMQGLAVSRKFYRALPSGHFLLPQFRESSLKEVLGERPRRGPSENEVGQPPAEDAEAAEASARTLGRSPGNGCWACCAAAGSARGTDDNSTVRPNTCPSHEAAETPTSGATTILSWRLPLGGSCPAKRYSATQHNILHPFRRQYPTRGGTQRAD